MTSLGDQKLYPGRKGSLAPGDGKLSLQRIVYDFVSIINILLEIGMAEDVDISTKVRGGRYWDS